MFESLRIKWTIKITKQVVLDRIIENMRKTKW